MIFRVALFTFVLTAAACAELLPEPWPAPPFELTDQDGNAFKSSELAGHVWICDFFFTYCAGPCPLMTNAVADLARQVRDPNVRFISFSVDPDRDTPARLNEYAQQRGITDSRWKFLTGPKKRIFEIAAAMKVAAMPGNIEHAIIHSDRFMVIDGRGQMRGTYRPLDVESFPVLVKDVQALAAPSRLLEVFPRVNASLNALAGILIVTALLLIRRQKYRAHAAVMIAAVVTSAAFLVCYITFHYLKTRQGILLTKFPDHPARPLYLVILTSHSILAAVVLPLILVTVIRAARRQWDRHTKIAPLTFWVWLYVSVTGVLVYWMLYHLAHPATVTAAVFTG